MPMTTALPGGVDAGYSAGLVIVVVGLATLFGQAVRQWIGIGTFVLPQIASRVLVVTLAALLYR